MIVANPHDACYSEDCPVLLLLMPTHITYLLLGWGNKALATMVFHMCLDQSTCLSPRLPDHKHTQCNATGCTCLLACKAHRTCGCMGPLVTSMERSKTEKGFPSMVVTVAPASRAITTPAHMSLQSRRARSHLSQTLWSQHMKGFRELPESDDNMSLCRCTTPTHWQMDESLAT